MDRLDLPADEHEHALTGLSRLNRWAGSARLFSGPIAARLAGAKAQHTLLDVACGAGDIPLELHRLARRHGWALDVCGCDRSALSVAHANRRAAHAHAGARFFVADALAGAPLPAADIVTCSLFAHHLSDDEAVALLVRLREACRGLLLVADLRRSRAGLALAATAAHLATRSRVVHADAPASVRAAFTLDEAVALSRRAGLSGALVRHAFPQRWLLSWSAA